jgi:hypothetical protein
MSRYFKKLIAFKLLIFVTISAFAPAIPSMPVAQALPVDPFRNLIHAIGMVETGFDTLAYNPLEEASGYFQIRPIRLKDYNIRTGSNFTQKDLFNYNVSEKIFMYYASKADPYDFETIARSWNGSGEQTKVYWSMVKACL